MPEEDRYTQSFDKFEQKTHTVQQSRSELASDYDLLPHDELQRLQTHVRQVFSPDTTHQSKVLTVVAAAYLNVQGGEPAQCRDGSKMRQDIIDTYLRRATAKAADPLDLHQTTVEGHCWRNRYNDEPKAQFFKDLVEVCFRFNKRTGKF